jgi:hypothetical protein
LCQEETFNRSVTNHHQIADMVCDAIEDRADESRGAQQTGLFIERQIAKDGAGAALMAWAECL